MIDLHIHTTASDGQYTPQETVRKACKAFVSVMAITDHDTVAGVEAACSAAGELGVTVLPGIELGASEAEQLHLLGYGIDITTPRLLSLCQWMQDNRDLRKYRIAEYLQSKGIWIKADEAERAAGNGNVGRPHFARLMLQKGYVKSIQEAFDQYLATKEFAAIERPKPAAQECIQIIREAGGIAVMAHPCLLRLPDEELYHLTAGLKEAGLEGMECYYSLHTEEQQQKYLDLAKRLNLYVTAGSDFHGEAVKPNVMFGQWKNSNVTLPF